jgi:hypothetical protein
MEPRTKEINAMTAMVVPVAMEEGVAAFVDELGMERELQMMLDWVRANVSGLVGIRVDLYPPHARPQEKQCVFLGAHRDLSREQALKDMIELNWGIWKAQTFPPRVCNHFTMMNHFYPF